MRSQWYGVNEKWVGSMVKVGPNMSFFRKINITTKHKSDHQFEIVVIRIFGIERIHIDGAVDCAFGLQFARGTVGHLWLVIV